MRTRSAAYRCSQRSCGSLTPWQARRKPALAQTSSGGSSPLKTVSAGPYRSASRRSSSLARWIKPFAHALPLRRGDQQRNQIQAPRAVQAIRIAVDVMRDAVFVDEPPRVLPTPLPDLAAPNSSNIEMHGLPVRAQRSVRADHFIAEDRDSTA